jgi:tetratricopeptide (TPR) repeat protein
MQCVGRHGRAYFHTQRGEWAEAAALYEQCTALYAPTDSRVSHLWLGPHPALARLGLGRVAEAAQWIADYLNLARTASAPHPVGCALRAQGQIFAAQQLRAEATLAFDEAIATLEGLGSRLELGRAFCQRGVFHQTLGQTQAARNDLRRALELFEACGAIRDFQQATVSRA